MTDLILTPAYGRDYKSKAAVMKDFLTGKDFIAQPFGRYANLYNLSVGDQVKFRYNKLRSTHLITVTSKMKEPSNV